MTRRGHDLNDRFLTKLSSKYKRTSSRFPESVLKYSNITPHLVYQRKHMQ